MSKPKPRWLLKAYKRGRLDYERHHSWSGFAPLTQGYCPYEAWAGEKPKGLRDRTRALVWQDGWNDAIAASETAREQQGES